MAKQRQAHKGGRGDLTSRLHTLGAPCSRPQTCPALLANLDTEEELPRQIWETELKDIQEGRI